MKNKKNSAIAMAIAMVINLAVIVLATGISSEIHWMVFMASATLLSVIATKRIVELGEETLTVFCTIAILFAILVVWNLTPEHYDRRINEWTVMCRFLLPFVWGSLAFAIFADGDYKKAVPMLKAAMVAFSLCAGFCFIGCLTGIGNNRPELVFHIAGILAAISGSVGCLALAYALWKNNILLADD